MFLLDYKSGAINDMTDVHGEVFMEYHGGLSYASSHSEHPSVLLTDLLLEKDWRNLFPCYLYHDFYTGEQWPVTQR